MFKRKIDELINKKRPSGRFVNRVESISEFINLYESKCNEYLPDRSSCVVNYYGIGGSGKTRLTNETKNIIKKDHIDYCFFTLDFKDQSIRLCPRALLALRTAYISNRKINFRHFDISYAIYFIKKNPDYVFNEKTLPFLEEAGIAGDLLGLLDSMGFAGSVTTISNWLYKQFNKKYISPILKDLLADLPNKTVSEIEEHLILFFSFDIEEHFKSLNNCVPVIYIDTFERLVSDGDSLNILPRDDKWIRELIINMPYAIFSIAGRNKLHWSDSDPNWLDIIRFRVVDNLTEKDSKELLISAGLSGTTLLSDIYIATGGHPYYLDLCLDIYHETSFNQESKNIADFSRKKSQLYDLFTETINRNLLDFLETISVGTFCSDDLYFHIADALNIQISFPQYLNIERFSFVTRRSDKFYLHDLMRGSLEGSLDGELKRKYASTLLSYYNKKLENTSKTEIVEYIEDVLSEALFLSNKSLIKSELKHWAENTCSSALRRLQLAVSSEFLISFISQIETTIYPEEFSPKLSYIKIDMIHIQGRYLEAVSMLDSLLEPYSDVQILKDDELIYLELRRLHHKMMFSPVDDLIERVKWLIENRENRLADKTYLELMFMLYGNLGALKGNFSVCRKGLVNIAKVAKQNNDNEMLCRILRKLADYYKAGGHVEVAHKMIENATLIAKNNGFERYLIYLYCTAADILRLKNEFTLALDMFKEAMQMAVKSGVPGWVGHCYLGMSALYLAKNDLEMAMEKLLLAEKYYQSIAQSWGLLHVCILKSKIMKARDTSSWEEVVNACFNSAVEMGYLYEQKLCEAFKSDSVKIKQSFMFL